MVTAARLTLTAVAALLAAAVATPAQADMSPRATSGPTISQGADGTERTLMCPPEEHVLGGGFTVSAPRGRSLDDRPGDLLTSRATADATGWIVAIRKSLEPAKGREHVHGHAHVAADLTLQVVCTEGEVSPGA